MKSATKHSDTDK